MERYAPLMVNIRDQFSFEIDVYPKTLASGYDMLEGYARSRHLFPKKKKGKVSYDKTKEGTI